MAEVGPNRGTTFDTWESEEPAEITVLNIV